MNFGPQTSEGDSIAIMDKALELGIWFWGPADATMADREMARILVADRSAGIIAAMARALGR